MKGGNYMKHEITMKEVQEKNCNTFMRKDDSPRGCECVMKSQLKVGDEIIIDNYFTLIVEWKIPLDIIPQP